MDNLLFTLNAILPIILPILLGYFLARIKFFKDGFLPELNKLVFKIMIPVLLFSNLYTADLSEIDWGFCGLCAAAIVLLFFVGLLIVILFIKDPKQKGVILQASFRSNYAIIGVPLATLLGGATAAAQASVVAAITVPIFNVLAVVSLSLFSDDPTKRPSVKSILINIIKNPLIIGVAAGLLVCCIGLGIDQLTGYTGTINAIVNGTDPDRFVDLSFIGKTVEYIARCATPLALIVLGGKFEFGAVRKLWKQLTLSVTLRLVITPAIFLVVFYFLGYQSSTEFAILIALFATPIAVSSAPMAAEMGQDEELAGQIVVWTSALSAITLFVIILICSGIGIFA